MKSTRAFKFILPGATLGLLVLGFQNCGQAQKFGQDASSSERSSQAASLDSSAPSVTAPPVSDAVAPTPVDTPAVSPAPAVDPTAGTKAPEIVDQKNYRVTCTALSGNTRTLTGSGTASGVVTVMAPSGQGMWAIQVSNRIIVQSLNCFSDQAYRAGSIGQFAGNSLCQEYGAKFGNACSGFGSCGYTLGVANPFKTCSIEAAP